jgi:hypothetical protein
VVTTSPDDWWRIPGDVWEGARGCGVFEWMPNLCHVPPQGGKGRTARFRLGRAQLPRAQPDHVEGHRSDEMLQMRFRQPNIASPAQTTATDALRVRALDPCSRRILALNSAVSCRCRAAWIASWWVCGRTVSWRGALFAQVRAWRAGQTR